MREDEVLVELPQTAVKMGAAAVRRRVCLPEESLVKESAPRTDG
jgi:hypothetical protein